jgi:hypothetical protein
MTKYPEWTQVICPVCNARYHEPCTAAYTLPKGTTLRLPHAARLVALEETKIDPSKRSANEV